jgi:hypothetical protein
VKADVKRRRAPGGGRKPGCLTSPEKRHKRYLTDPSHAVAEAAALLTWPHTNGDKRRSIKEAIDLAIEEWGKLLHVYEPEIARLGIRIRRPNWDSVHKLVKDGRTAARTYERRGAPRHFSAEEEHMLAEIRSERPVPNPMLVLIKLGQRRRSSVPCRATIYRFRRCSNRRKQSANANRRPNY